LKLLHIFTSQLKTTKPPSPFPTLGLNVTNWQNICNAFTQRTQGFLTDLINVINSFLGQVPDVGPYIVSPVLVQLNQLLVDAQTGMATAISGVLSAVQMLLSIVNLLGNIFGPSASTEAIQDYLLGIVGITNPPPQCATQGGCEGAIMAFSTLLNGVYSFLDSINFFGSSEVAPLQSVANTFLTALNTATAATITGVVNTFVTATAVVISNASNLVGIQSSIISDIESALDILSNAAEAISTCYINNPTLYP